MLAGADPLLEARALYAESSQLLSHYLVPLEGIDIVRPNHALHAQASGRWSTTDPPLQQLPHDMRGIIQPHAGYCWIYWDWDQIELRILAALSSSRFLLEVFGNGWDLHTLTACQMFNLPAPPDKTDPHTSPACEAWRVQVGWQGKDDARRVFAKRGRYKLNYGGEPNSVIPGEATLGIKPAERERALVSMLMADPDLASWRRRIAAEVQRTQPNAISHTFQGRRRALMSFKDEQVRQAYNHPMQGGNTDIFNLTIVEIKQRVAHVAFAWGMHDSQYWHCPLEHADVAGTLIAAIAQKEWLINGHAVTIPAKVGRKYHVDRATTSSVTVDQRAGCSDEPRTDADCP